MAFANANGWLVLTTGNKSEAAVGYSTLYGDTAGAYAVIKDVYKTGVYGLARWRNESVGNEIIPHSTGYGIGSEERLTGEHETQRFDQFSYGVSDRGASIRIPWQVHLDQKGYIEDRRPNANMDPYVVARLITNTCCS